jgi:hypothetical protein
MEKLALSVAVPTDIYGHGGDSNRVHNDGDKAGVFEFVDRIEAFGHGGLRADNARVVSVVVEMDVMVVVVFYPAAVEIKRDDGRNEDGKGHNVVDEIHKRLPFLGGLQPRRAVVRGVNILLCGNDTPVW